MQRGYELKLRKKVYLQTLGSARKAVTKRESNVGTLPAYSSALELLGVFSGPPIATKMLT